MKIAFLRDTLGDIAFSRREEIFTKSPDVTAIHFLIYPLTLF